MMGDKWKLSSTLKDPKTGDKPEAVATSPEKNETPQVTFPPVEGADKYATRRDQLGNKAETSGRGRGRGRGKPSKEGMEEVATSSEGPIVRRTAAKSKASPKDALDTEERP